MRLAACALQPLPYSALGDVTVILEMRQSIGRYRQDDFDNNKLYFISIKHYLERQGVNGVGKRMCGGMGEMPCELNDQIGHSGSLLCLYVIGRYRHDELDNNE